MNKPEKKEMNYYDFNECEAFLEALHGYDIRDYAGRWRNGFHPDKPYQDFWHFIVENGRVSNDSLLEIFEYWGEDAEDWQKTILEHFMDEFGEGEPGDRVATFWLSW